MLRLFSGGQYISQNKTEVSNSAFSQLRYDYQINDKSRYFMFTQLQSNAILLFNRRLLGGLGYRRNLINIEIHCLQSTFIDGVWKLHDILHECE